MATPLDIAVLAGRNSLDFLEAAFRLYEEERVFAITRDGLDLAAYPGLCVRETVPCGARRGWGRLRHAPSLSDAPAQVVFTSGTEGRPKPIVLSHRNLADVVGRLNDIMQVDDGIREYVGIPVTYSFGLGRARAVAAAGGEVFLPERFDPAEIRAMLEAGEINAVSAVPSLWRIVLATPEAIGPAGARVRWIEIGSQYMSQAEKEGMKRLFPEARIVQHYGLTEASRTTFLDISATQGAALESVGTATGRAEVRLGPGDAIAIRGAHVALGRLGADGTIAPLTDAEGWLETKDRGALRDGLLWYLGRLDDQINVAGVKTSAERLEQEIRDLAGGAGGFAVAPLPDPLRGDRVLLALTPALGDRAALVECAAGIALRRQGIGQAGLISVLNVDDLPRTGTGKVQRQALRAQYLAEAPDPAGAGPDPVAPAPGLGPDEQRIAALWQRTVGAAALRPDQSFYDIGGDSLSSVQIALVMEKSGFDRAAVRATMEGRPLGEVAALIGGAAEAPGTPPAPTPDLPRQTVESWSISAVRGVMVLSVLLSHWGPGLFDRLGISAVMEQTISVIYRMGTPGFAVIFGVGLGYFMLPGFPGNRASVRRRLRLACALVLAGLVFRAAAILGLAVLEDRPVDGLLIAVTFYNILAYYGLALLVAVLWLDGLARCRDPVLTAFAAALGCWVAWRGAGALLPAEPLETILEWPRLMLVANYSYFRLTAFALAGIAVGYWMARQADPALDRRLLILGGLGTAVTAIIAVQAYGPMAFSVRLGPFFVSALGAIFYLSAAVLLLGAAAWLLRGWARLPGPVRRGGELVIVIGGLALPIYALHSVVIPVKDILALTGVPGPVALLVPLGIFLGGMGYAGWHLHRSYFR